MSPGDKYLVDLIRKGDKKAFEHLFKTYYSDLCRYAKNIVKIDSVAEDLVMDLFVKLWESENKLNITSSLSGYLYQSVHNHALNYLTRKHKRFSELNQETIERLNALFPESGGPLEEMTLTELISAVDRSVENLPEECRKIFIMSRNNEMPHKEIAASLGISENTVKVQIYRALKKIKDSIKEFLPEAE